jgi:hypothetical protein
MFLARWWFVVTDAIARQRSSSGGQSGRRLLRLAVVGK